MATRHRRQRKVAFLRTRLGVIETGGREWEGRWNFGTISRPFTPGAQKRRHAHGGLGERHSHGVLIAPAGFATSKAMGFIYRRPSKV
jgi:hypothetical protein